MKHVVCFKLKEPNEEILNKTKDLLLTMKENISVVEDVQVGLDFLHSERSFDILLEVTLNSREDLDTYQFSDYHVNVILKHMKAIIEKSIAVDYIL